MTSMPSLTAIIATYNWSSVLRYSIASALAQTFTDFELLVIGDGCTDDSEAVVAGSGDPRVRWINLPANIGHQTGPNNEGLRQARGEFIAYLGHDDLWLPHHLECMVSALATGADLAYGLTERVGPDGRFVELVPLRSAYRRGDWLPPSAVAHRRAVTDHVGGWRDQRRLGVDPEADLWRRAYDGKHSFACVPRLTTVKFPALWRRNVYSERPCHEQAAWMERLGRERDLESVELTRLRATTSMLPIEKGKRLWRRLFMQASLYLPMRRSTRIDARRRFKGLALYKRAEAGRVAAARDRPDEPQR